MARRRRPPQWHLLFTFVGLLAAIVAGLYASRRVDTEGDPLPTQLPNLGAAAPVQPDAASFAEALRGEVDSTLAGIGIVPTAISSQAIPGAADTIRVRVPRDLPLASVNRELTERVLQLGGYVVEGRESGSRSVQLAVGIDSTMTTLFHLRHDSRAERRRGRLALVVDIDGAPAARLRRLDDLGHPLTLLTSGSAPAAAVDDPQRQILQRPPASTRFDEGAVTADDVTRHLWALAERAATDGQVVAIADLRPATLSALEEMMPRLERRGYRFVTVAELTP